MLGTDLNGLVGRPAEKRLIAPTGDPKTIGDQHQLQYSFELEPVWLTKTNKGRKG